MTFDVARTCRLDGEQPTTRERWLAFYRLWRLIKNKRSAQETEEAGLCIRVLMNSWQWIHLVQGNGDTYDSLRFMPVEIRWSMLGKPRPKLVAMLKQIMKGE